jgi:ERCC4-type nuclease
MKFNPYTPKGGDLPVKYYSVDVPDVSIGKKKGVGLCVIAPDEFTATRVNKELLSHGIDLSELSLTGLLPILSGAGLIERPTRHSRGYNPRSYPNKGSRGGSFRGGFSENLIPKTSSDLIVEAQSLDISTAPFKVSSQKNLAVVVSSNEPNILVNLLRQSKLVHVNAAHLDVADIVVTNMKTGDTLFIERKTVQDMYQSVMNGAHSHDQSERMFDAVQQLKLEGKRARAIWIVEAQQNGKHLLDNALPKIQNMSGLVNYFDMVNEQSVHQSYSVEHTAYLVCKYAQGFMEQCLPYRVETNNPKVHRSGKERIAAKVVDGVRASGEVGVKRHTARDITNMLSYVPSITTKVAKNLANTGKTFSEVTLMTIEELEAIDGVGKKSAQKIFDDFNAKL